MIRLFFVVLSCLFLSACDARQTSVIADNGFPGSAIQGVAVTVRVGNTSGSGLVVHRRTSDGKKFAFVWTAGHVVEWYMVASISNRANAAPITIVKTLISDGRIVGHVELSAKVLKWSGTTNGHDLAVLVLLPAGILTNSVVFAEDKPPDTGTEICCVGSPNGSAAMQSLSSGIVSRVGQSVNGKIFDQSSCFVIGGMSGGGVFRKDGKCLGILVRKIADIYSMYVPARRIRDWAESESISWAFDRSVRIPSEMEILGMSAE